MKKETRNLVIFFTATILWTWACYSPIAAGQHNPYEMPWLVFFILGGMGPSLVGIVMVLLRSGKEERGDYWRRCFSVRRIGGAWWALILVIFPLIYGLSIAADLALGGALPGMDQLTALIANPLAIPLAAFISFMSGPWSEEFGWRGYALERIIKPFGVIPGSILLGLVWGVWHLPLYFMPATWHGQMGFQLAGFWTFMIHSVGLSLLMTWVYLNTHRSILSGILMHFASNFTGQLMAPASNRVEVMGALVMLGAGLAVCLMMNAQKQKDFQLAEPKPTL